MNKKRGGKISIVKPRFQPKDQPTDQLTNKMQKVVSSVKDTIRVHPNYSNKQSIFDIMPITIEDLETLKLYNDSFKLDLLKEILKDFNKGNYNENLIYNDDFFNKQYKQIFKSGGGKLVLKNYDITIPEDAIKASSELDKYITHINTMDSTNQANSIIIRKNDADLIKSIAEINITQDKIENAMAFQKNYENLYNYIKNNNNAKEIEVNIPVVDTFAINSLNNIVYIENGNPEYIIKNSYKCRDYNELIVTDFEHNFINAENQQYLIEFIAEQNEYMKRLDESDKCIINDYTNQNANNFYQRFKRCDHTLLKDNNAYNFGDAYLSLIIEYIIDKYFEVRHLKTPKDKFYYVQKNHIMLEFIDNDIYNYELNGLNELDDEAKRKAILMKMNSKTDEFKRIYETKPRASDNDPSIFKHKLLEDDWYNILSRFECRLNNIIQRAPKPKKPIYCYRGVSDINIKQKIHEFNKKEFSLKCYCTSNISSFTLDYNTAYYFYTEYTNDVTRVKPNACLYRTTIMPGCDMLFANALSLYPNEFEIIIASNSIILDGNGWNDNTPKIRGNMREFQKHIHDNAKNIKYNNKNNEYGLIGKPEDKLQTFDIIIIGNSSPIENYKEACKKIEKINECLIKPKTE
jgi:hypothetical protein